MACNFVKGWVVLIVVHFVVQVTLQGVTFRDNEHAKDLTSLCLSLAQVPSGLPLLERDNLTMCDGIPGRNNVTCILLVSGGMPSPPSPVNDMDSSALTDFDLDDIHNITLSGTEHFITGRCAMSLQWIHDVWVIKIVLAILCLTLRQFSRQCGRRYCYDLLPVLAPDRVSVGSK